MATAKNISCASILVLFIIAVCGLGETQIESKSVSNPTIYCYRCQDQCIDQCRSQGRECCCGLPSSTPLPPPIPWYKCPTEEKKRGLVLRKSEIDCNLCVKGCKTKCDRIGGTVTRQVCFQDFQFGTMFLIDTLLCPCCCKINPSPLPHSPSPPPP
ncbi:hypothetical protein MKW94_026669 [Papaver nudicaule]|uniref:Uncharacterized protein n=1 Tax=Papaver nudicaule TaxID=74823 RepID=A0AA41VNK5_PAPNU|nr:hypothetical protein [Papaver nudicaule]